MNKLKKITINKIINDDIKIPLYTPEPLFYPLKKIHNYKVIKYKQFNSYQINILASSLKSPKLICIRINSDYGCINIKTSNIQIYNFTKRMVIRDYHEENCDYYEGKRNYYYKEKYRNYYVSIWDADIEIFIKKFIELLKKEYILVN